MLRLLGKATVAGVCVVGGVPAALYTFERYENSYWRRKDPWRTQRLEADGKCNDQTFGWTEATAGAAATPSADDASTTVDVRSARPSPLLASSPPGVMRIVILGTGWGAIEMARSLSKDDGIEVRIVSPRNHFLFSPLLPSAASGTLPASSICSPVRSLISYKNAPLWKRAVFIARGKLPAEVRFYSAAATDVDFANKIVWCSAAPASGGAERQEFGMTYDKLVIAVGSTTNTFGTRGVEENASFMKEIQDGVRVRNAVFQRFEQAALPMSDDDRKKLLSFVVVGGGPTGVEVAAELQDLIDEDLAGSRKGHGNTLYKNALRSGACVTLVQSGDGLLKGYDPNCSAMALSEMSAAGINVLLRHRVKEVTNTGVKVMDKKTKKIKTIDASLVVWATGVGPIALTQTIRASIGQEAQGNVRAIVVDPKLRVLGVEEQGSVYALGDCATVARSSLLNDFKDSFEAHDTDEDGSLEAVELQACLDDIRIRNPHAGRFLNKAATMMKEFDTNGDGRLDRKEFDTLLKHIDRRHRSLPPTAAVAQQQAVYLSAVLNAEASAMAGGTAQPPPKDFEFHSRGQAAYVGKNVSIIGFGEDAKLIMADGYGFTYLVWRAMYLSMVPDVRSMAAISYGWLSTVVFGRDSGVW